MNSFAISCLVAASASAVSLNSSFQHPWMKAELNNEDRAILRSGLDASVVDSLKKLNRISNGDDLRKGASNKIVVFDMPQESADSEESDEESEDETKQALKSGIPFEMIQNVRPEEKLDVVIAQIQDGFQTLSKHNKEIEDDRMEEAQEEQQEKIEDIIEEANEEAVEIIEDADDVSDAAEDVEEVFEERQEEIADVNAEHTEKVQTISKNQVIAEVANQQIESEVLTKILSTAAKGGDVNSVIVDAHLPFPVKEPGTSSDPIEAPEDQLNRMICRSGDCIENVKKDPEFDVFLNAVLGGFIGVRTAPDRPQAVGNVDFSPSDLKPRGVGAEEMRLRQPFSPSAMKVGAPSHVGSDMSIGQPVQGSEMKMGAPAFTTKDHRIGAPFQGDVMTLQAPDLSQSGSQGFKPYNNADLRVGNPGRPGRPDMAQAASVVAGRSANYRDEVPAFSVDRDDIVGVDGFRPIYDDYSPTYAGPGDFRSPLAFERPNDALKGVKGMPKLTDGIRGGPGLGSVRPDGMLSVRPSDMGVVGNMRPDLGPMRPDTAMMQQGRGFKKGGKVSHVSDLMN